MLTEVVRSSKKFKNKYKNPFSADSNSTSILQKKENYNMQYLRRMVLVFTCVMLMGELRRVEMVITLQIRIRIPVGRIRMER